jgi:hypothetical protein
LDGPLLDSGFAQPSGIASDGKNLYVADSESNIIREIDLQSGEVKTLVGGNLFDFGDVDATGDAVRLQHPLGLVLFGDKFLIADTYNHKIKELDPKRKRVSTFLGSGKPGQIDGASASFYEPGGLSVANGKLYIADTNNHAIRVVDLKTKQTSTLRLNGLTPPAKSTATAGPDAGPNGEDVGIRSQSLRAGTDGFLVVNVDLPTGYHLNPSAPQRFSVSVDNSKAIAIDPTQSNHVGNDLRLPVRVPLRGAEAGLAKLNVQLTLFYCREDNTGTCRIKTLRWQAPVEVTNDASAPTEIKIQGKLSSE